MKFISATKDQDGFYNYQLQLDETNINSPVKPFRYSPFIPRNGQTEIQYIALIEAEIQQTTALLKNSWIAQGSPLPAVWVASITTSVPLASAGKVF